MTSDDIASLRRFKNLEVLLLGGTAVTDSVLVHLNSLKKLRVVELRMTKVTRQGIQDFQASRPDVTVLATDYPTKESKTEKKRGRDSFLN